VRPPGRQMAGQVMAPRPSAPRLGRHPRRDPRSGRGRYPRSDVSRHGGFRTTFQGAGARV